METQTQVPLFENPDLRSGVGLTIVKRYVNLKAAHRQWRHSGHCHYVHGENWGFDIEFACDRLDSNGFVVDFGKMRGLSDTMDRMLIWPKVGRGVTQPHAENVGCAWSLLCVLRTTKTPHAISPNDLVNRGDFLFPPG